VSDAPQRDRPVLAVDLAGSSVVVRLGGELDLYNAEHVRAALASAADGDHARVVVDMSQVEFVDSTALTVLVEARRKLGKERFVLAAPQAAIRRTLSVSGIDRHLVVRDSVEDALSGS
jgi:anti-anti-sigma factor